MINLLFAIIQKEKDNKITFKIYWKKIYKII